MRILKKRPTDLKKSSKEPKHRLGTEYRQYKQDPITGKIIETARYVYCRATKVKKYTPAQRRALEKVR